MKNLVYLFYLFCFPLFSFHIFLTTIASATSTTKLNHEKEKMETIHKKAVHTYISLYDYDRLPRAILRASNDEFIDRVECGAEN